MSAAVFILPFAANGTGIRVAIKDLIDVEGTPTTAGCRAVADSASAASHDAQCLDGLREAERKGEVRLVGKTNLHELAFGADGVNHAFGTPINPVDSARIPGGSSSGSAVAIAAGLADVAVGSDTGGSIRIPAACCGIVGLKTTWGRISRKGVWPLAPFLDTIGPMATTVAGTVMGMQLLEPGFANEFDSSPRPRTVGRLRLRGGGIDPCIDAAVDAALLATGAAVLDVTLPFWNDAHEAAITVLLAQAWRTDAHLIHPTNRGVSSTTEARLRLGESITDEQLARAQSVRAHIVFQLQEFFDRFDVLALPTLTSFAPLLTEAAGAPLTALTRFANITGLPALAMPIPIPARLRKSSTAHLGASLQLIGPPNAEATVLQGGAMIESATV
jgi:amidase